jgi:hypothetical protein
MSTKRIETAAAACEAATAKLMEFVGMAEVKTDELTGPALDWAVAKAAGIEIDDSRGKELRVSVCAGLQSPWVPTVNWHQCGPLIESLGDLSMTRRYSDDWLVLELEYQGEIATWMARGSTMLIAICRALVVSKFGETVLVPAELLQQ